MKHMRHIKKIHNGKNRRTNQKVRRNKNSGGIPDSTGFQQIKLEEKQAKQAKQDKRQKKIDSRGPCCQNSAAIKAKNEQLLSELRSTSKGRTLKAVGSKWVEVPMVPPWFIANNRSHMAHFRQYVEAMNLPYKF
ncbi:MAG: hypothetical protein QMC43_01490 [Candidatus Poseidoniaceae archaeon]|jgi:hypothetical protein